MGGSSDAVIFVDVTEDSDHGALLCGIYGSTVTQKHHGRFGRGKQNKDCS